jgi:hypothetical protein
MRIAISHGAGGDWFVVKPLPGTTRTSVAGTQITHEMEVENLLAAGRRVYEVDLDKLTVVKMFKKGAAALPDLDELLAWLRDAGYHQYALDLIEADPDERSGVAYEIAEHVAQDPMRPDTELLPAQLRTWADTQEFSSDRERGAAAPANPG